MQENALIQNHFPETEGNTGRTAEDERINDSSVRTDFPLDQKKEEQTNSCVDDKAAVEKLTDVMDPADAGISCEDGMLQPMMSLVGLYLISTEDILSDCGDCACCIGQKEGCRFCANYVKRS